MSGSDEFRSRTMLSRRSFLRLSGMASVATLLAACPPTAAPQPDVDAPGVTEPVEVRVQDWGGDWAEIAQEQFSEFEQQNPGIRIIYEPYQEGWQERTMASMVAGTAPEIIHAWGDVFSEFADRGQLVNLEPLFQETYSAEEAADFHSYMIEAMERDGFRHAMPKHVWLGILYYNKDAFDEAGVGYPEKSWTHDDYSTAMEQLTVRDDAGNVTRWGGYIPAWSFDRVMPKVLAWGGNVVDQETHTQSRLHEEPAQEALEWVRSRMWDTNTIAQSLQVENLNGYESMMEGWVAMAEEGTSWIVRVANTFDGNFDIMHHPEGPVTRASLGGTNGYAIYKGAEERGALDASWEVMQFLTSAEFQRAMLAAESRTIVPSRLSAVPDFLDSIRRQAPKLEEVNVDVILEALEEGYPRAADPQTFQNHAAAAEIINPALEQIFLVGSAPASIFVDLEEEINATQTQD